MGNEPTDLAAGLATTRFFGLVERGLKKAFGEQAAEAVLTNLQHAGVTLAKAILFHPQSSAVLDAFMIGVHEVVSGKKPVPDAMTAAAKKANAAIRG